MSLRESTVVSSVKVLVRIRPRLNNPQEEGKSATHLNVQRAGAQNEGTRSQLFTNVGVKVKDSLHQFQFDGVFDETATQEDVFVKGNIGQLVNHVVNGYNATIFAYGQTGSGKTFTIDGYGSQGNVDDIDERAHVNRKAEAGLTLRCLQSCFLRLKQLLEQQQAQGQIQGDPDSQSGSSTSQLPRQQVAYRVRCSFIQIYQEQVYDLLAPVFSMSESGSSSSSSPSNPSSLRVRWSRERGFFVDNLTEHMCSSVSEASSCFRKGAARRVIAQHKLNDASSRAHAVFTIMIDRYASSGIPDDPPSITTSTLSIVDLAGSERVSQTQAQGRVLAESIGINKSLFVLRKVIKALASSQGESSNTASQSTHVPYRDSTLTRLLKHSLGGSCLTVMVACIAPLDLYLEENLSTLNYAAMTRRIVNRAVVCSDPKLALIKKLTAENGRLRAMLERARQLFLQGGGDANLDALKGHSPQIDEHEAENGSAHPSTSSPKSRIIVEASKFASHDDSQSEIMKAKLVEALEMAQELLLENEALRADNEGLSTEAEEAIQENNDLSYENEDLSDRVAFLEEAICGGMTKEEIFALHRFDSSEQSSKQNSDPNSLVNVNEVSELKRLVLEAKAEAHRNQKQVQRLEALLLQQDHSSTNQLGRKGQPRNAKAQIAPRSQITRLSRDQQKVTSPQSFSLKTALSVAGGRQERGGLSQTQTIQNQKPEWNLSAAAVPTVGTDGRALGIAEGIDLSKRYHQALEFERQTASLIASEPSISNSLRTELLRPSQSGLQNVNLNEKPSQILLPQASNSQMRQQTYSSAQPSPSSISNPSQTAYAEWLMRLSQQTSESQVRATQAQYNMQQQHQQQPQLGSNGTRQYLRPNARR